MSAARDGKKGKRRARKKVLPRGKVPPPSHPFTDRKKEASRRACRDPVEPDDQ